MFCEFYIASMGSINTDNMVIMFEIDETSQVEFENNTIGMVKQMHGVPVDALQMDGLDFKELTLGKPKKSSFFKWPGH